LALSGGRAVHRSVRHGAGVLLDRRMTPRAQDPGAARRRSSTRGASGPPWHHAPRRLAATSVMCASRESAGRFVATCRLRTSPVHRPAGGATTAFGESGASCARAATSWPRDRRSI
jgi:hypothetical protein